MKNRGEGAARERLLSTDNASKRGCDKMVNHFATASFSIGIFH